MFKELKVNGTLLPRPDDDITLKNEKQEKEYDTEAGTTMVSVYRTSKITVSGTWTVTGTWLKAFRAWADADTVTVLCFYPNGDEMTEHECRLSITQEKHIRFSRDFLNTDGLYEIGVKMEEL